MLARFHWLRTNVQLQITAAGHLLYCEAFMSDAVESVESHQSVLTSEAFKDYLGLASFMLTAGALTFDVGYFSGVDINFFTLFSVTEHILFALEALPLVFIIIYVGAMIGHIVIDARKTFSFSLASMIGWITSLSIGWQVLRFLVAFVLWLGLALLFYRFRTEALPALLAGGFLATVIVSPEVLGDRRIALPFVAAVGLFVVFFIGRWTAREYIASEVTDHQLRTPEGTVSGRIIRSGERGLLFVDVDSHLVRFFKWDDVQELSTVTLLPSSRER
jgi:hypothetical protein